MYWSRPTGWSGRRASRPRRISGAVGNGMLNRRHGRNLCPLFVPWEQKESALVRAPIRGDRARCRLAIRARPGRSGRTARFPFAAADPTNFIVSVRLMTDGDADEASVAGQIDENFHPRRHLRTSSIEKAQSLPFVPDVPPVSAGSVAPRHLPAPLPIRKNQPGVSEMRHGSLAKGSGSPKPL